MQILSKSKGWGVDSKTHSISATFSWEPQICFMFIRLMNRICIKNTKYYLTAIKHLWIELILLKWRKYLEYTEVDFEFIHSMHTFFIAPLLLLEYTEKCIFYFAFQILGEQIKQLICYSNMLWEFLQKVFVSRHFRKYTLQLWHFYIPTPFMQKYVCIYLYVCTYVH